MTGTTITTSTPQGPQSYYYPGGSAGGPVPFTHKKLLIWGGYQRWLQNQGNANHLSSYIPTPEMMAGDFSTDNADNQALCPYGFYQGAPPSGLNGGILVQRPRGDGACEWRDGVGSFTDAGSDWA